jgi:hypothetical protein
MLTNAEAMSSGDVSRFDYRASDYLVLDVNDSFRDKVQWAGVLPIFAAITVGLTLIPPFNLSYLPSALLFLIWTLTNKQLVDLNVRHSWVTKFLERDVTYVFLHLAQIQRNVSPQDDDWEDAMHNGEHDSPAPVSELFARYRERFHD